MDAFNTIASDVLTVKRSVPDAVLPEQDTPGGSIFLSSIDNVALAIMSTVYSFDRSDANVAGVIKQPLSKVLVYYYPLAGRLAKNSQGKFTVDCQKKFGVPFLEASANCDIEKLGDIQIMDPDILGKLVYRDPTENMLEVGPLLTAQLIKELISSAAKKIKKTIERVTEDYVRSSLDYMDMYQYDSYSVTSQYISSWLRLDYGCIDFGWGGPRQLSTGNTPPNLCMFMREESENKKGILVVLGLPLSAMSTFQESVQIQTRYQRFKRAHLLFQ
ncbi:hypothetical protein NL676_013959 [Syzygium grande]|nr:hypothetical protein NL676_013959 [Syzygium grande]